MGVSYKWKNVLQIPYDIQVKACGVARQDEYPAIATSLLWSSEQMLDISPRKTMVN